MRNFYIDVEENASEKLPKFMVNKVQRNATEAPSLDRTLKRVSILLPKVSELRGQAAMKNYCNSPGQKTTGNEGNLLMKAMIRQILGSVVSFSLKYFSRLYRTHTSN